MYLNEFYPRLTTDPAPFDLMMLRLCRELSKESFDPSTKCGAIIVRDDDLRIEAAEVNAFPECFDKKIYDNRPEKYKRVIHAEMNAILKVNQWTTGWKHTLYTYPALPCNECVKHVIGVRHITRCVFAKATEDYLSRWGEHTKTTLRLLEEAGIPYREYNLPYYDAFNEAKK